MVVVPQKPSVATGLATPWNGNVETIGAGETTAVVAQGSIGIAHLQGIGNPFSPKRTE